MARETVGIVGYGVVGRSMHTLLGDDAVTYDVDGGAADRARINRCEFVFLCVPTPCRPDGSCDASIVEECVEWISGPRIVIRSTVAPGTTDRLVSETGKSIVFQPEYIGETPDHPLADIRKHRFIILGGRTEDCSAVADLYARYYHSEVRFYFTNAKTAEVAKYMENSFYAVKVMFCNEFFDIARSHGVDYNELREVWLADPRISRDHTFVYPQDRGFSGKCLPKDISAVIHSCHEKGYTPQLLEWIMDANEKCREHDSTYIPYRRSSRKQWQQQNA